MLADTLRASLPVPTGAVKVIGVHASSYDHRTIDRVTRILETVACAPGMTFGELARAMDAPRSSVHGLVRGLVASGCLFESDRHFYLGSAILGLTLACGHTRAGLVTQPELQALSTAARAAAFLGVPSGDHLIYVAEAGADEVSGYEFRSNMRRSLLGTAGGRALLAAWSSEQREGVLRRCAVVDPEGVDTFLQEFEEVQRSGIARRRGVIGARLALAAAVRNQAGEAVASISLVGSAADMELRAARVSKQLMRQVGIWSRRLGGAREAV